MLILNGESRAESLLFTPDGTRLVVGRGDGHVDLWALPSGEFIRSIQYPGVLAFIHPSGDFVCSSERSLLATVSLRTGEVIAGGRNLSGWGRIIVSPDGTHVVAAGGRGEIAACRFLLLTTEDIEEDVYWRKENEERHLCNFVSNERFVAIATLSTVNKKQLTIRDVATGNVLSSVPYPSHSVRHTTTSPDGSKFAAMGHDKLYVWDTATWSKPTRFATPNRAFSAFVFHPTKPLLMAVQRGQHLVKFFDTVNWRLAKRFEWKLGEVTSVAFSPDGTLAVAGTASGKVIVWDVDE